ncbi:MAG TPA: glycosyltransferase family 4 protein, partial [Flavitalea sp.]|nr:glycosyltransferase family 4 protein [Flavitalea sp.]
NLKYKNFNVIFRGPKTELELVKELLSADVFIHPSHIDNSPNSVCEAMLLGMPVIASYVGGIPSLIEDKHNGVLYNSNDPYELASKILLTVKDKELIAELSKNARATGIDRHDHEQIRSTVLATYNRIIQKDKLKTA